MTTFVDYDFDDEYDEDDFGEETIEDWLTVYCYVCSKPLNLLLEADVKYMDGKEHFVCRDRH